MSSVIVAKQMGYKYPWEIRRAACERWYACGNQRAVSDIMNIPYETLQAWKKTEWWNDLLNEFKIAEAAQLDTKIKSIIDKSLDIVQDRLENGEIIMNNKTGELTRKEVGLRDTTRVAAELITKRLAIERATEEVQIKKDSMAETLKMLANEFAKWNKKASSPPIEDAVIIENGEE